MPSSSRKLTACVFLALLAQSSNSAAQDDSAADAAIAANEAQRSATMAALTGTAEGLYRGCKASYELRTGHRSEPDLVLALDLASQCEAFAKGVAATTTLSHPLLLAGGCRINDAIEPRLFVDAVVYVVKTDPLLIGQTTTQLSLTLEAFKAIAHCGRYER